MAQDDPLKEAMDAFQPPPVPEVVCPHCEARVRWDPGTPAPVDCPRCGRRLPAPTEN